MRITHARWWQELGVVPRDLSVHCLGKAQLKIAYLQLSSNLFANMVDVAIIMVRCPQVVVHGNLI